MNITVKEANQSLVEIIKIHLQGLQSGKFGVPNLEDLQFAGKLHIFISGEDNPAPSIDNTAFLYPCSPEKDGNYSCLLDERCGCGQGSFNWLNNNNKNWFIDKSYNPEFLFFNGIYYYYGKEGYRKSCLNELKKLQNGVETDKEKLIFKKDELQIIKDHLECSFRGFTCNDAYIQGEYSELLKQIISKKLNFRY